MNMYFIAIVCPEEINRRVVKWKLWMKEKYGCEAALKSPAHITLVPPFWMKPGLEDELQHFIFEFSTNQVCFPVQLNNFSCFKPKVIFVHVVENLRLSEIRDELTQRLVSANKFPIENDDRPFHPHVTIATRDLHKKSFYEAWDHFNENRFMAEWSACGISLLRHNKKNWDVIITSQFKQV